MSGGLAMRPMPTQAPDETTESMMSAAKKAQVAKNKPIGKMGMPKKEAAPAGDVIMGGEGMQIGSGGEDNPADYKLMNSPSEGVFLQNMKTGKAMSLTKASQMPGFEALYEEGIQAGEALRKQAFGKL